MTPERLGRRLKQLRRAAKLTQATLARKAQVSQAAISDYEQGRRSPDFLVVAKLAEALGVTTDAFLVEPTADPEGELVAALAC